MLRDIQELQGSQVIASDGRVGKVTDFYFDDHSWTVRFLIVDTGNWILKHDVLVSPLTVERASIKNNSVSVALSKTEVEHCPSIDLAGPVGRQSEFDAGSNIYALHTSSLPDEVFFKPEEKDHHLRSWLELHTYRIRTNNGSFSKISSLIIDDETWEIRSLVLQNGSLLHKRLVKVSPLGVKSLNWPACVLEIDLAHENSEAQLALRS